MRADFVPNSIQIHNARFVPNRTEIRWLHDDQMSCMMRVAGMEFMESTNNSANVCLSYFNLRPGAFRADLWRALVLWKYGGLYLDHKLMMVAHVSKWINLNRSKYAMVPTNDPDFCTPCLHNGIAYASEERLSLYSCVVKQIVSNVDQKMVFGKSLYSVTGPAA